MAVKKITTVDFYGREETYILDEESGKKYCRILGGFAWPSVVEAGFGVVVAEDWQKDELFKKKHYRVLAEYENQSPEELIKRCAELSSLYLVDTWYGDTDNRTMMEFFYKDQHRFYLTNAPLLDDPNSFESSLLRIREHTRVNHKTLHFGPESRLPKLLMEISSQDSQKLATARSAAKEFPAIAALGYVISALDLYKYDPDEQAIVNAGNAQLAKFYDY